MRALFVALALAAAPAPPVAAGPPPAPAAAAAADFPRTAAEDEIWQLYGANKLLTARRKVDELLTSSPDSIVGLYVLGRILHEVEGTPTAAMRHLGRARELYETSHGGANLQSSPLHREILFAIQLVAGELERHEYRLAILEYHDSLYRPGLTADRAWALLQLGRIDEARALAEKAAASQDPDQRSLGLNALCGIAGHGRDRAAWQSACALAHEHATARAAADSPFAKPDEITSTTVHAYNAALAARGMLDWDRVEATALAGTRRVEFTAADPWRLLVDLYVGQGRVVDAIAAAREMQRWRAQQPPSLRTQVRADTEASYAALLLVAGRTAQALPVIERALAQPDRRGLTTATRGDTLAAHALLRRALWHTHAEVLAERATWLGTREAIAARIDRANAELASWTDGERIIGVLADDEQIISTFELFGQRGVQAPVWLLGDLVDVLGPGICAVALERAEARMNLPALAPYHGALWTEIEWRTGNDVEALRRADAALAGLPVREALLAARVAAIAARAAWNEHGLAAALPYFTRALELDGGVLRRLGLTLPAAVKGPDDGAGAIATDLLASSPRLDAHANAFTIVVSGTAAELQACLQSPVGVSMFCVTAPPPPEPEPGTDAEPDDDRQRAARLAQAFHERAFAMPMQLSNVDLGSLDGTSTVASEAARAKSQALLEGLGQ